MALPYTHADDDAAEDMSEEARSILAEVDALLADGESPLPERLARLRALVRKVQPTRRRVAVVGRPDVKLPLSSPTLAPADLAAALRADLPSAPLARGRRNAFKEAEARFRAVVGEEDAVAAGAVDFGATGAWRGDASVAAALGIVTLCPPAAADSPSAAAAAEGAGCFAPSGGIYGLAHAPGFYHLPASLTAGQQAYWIRRILRGYVEPPNRRNIDAAADPDYSNLVRDGLVEDGATSTAAAGGAVAAPGSASAGGDAGGGDRFRRGLWPEYVAAADGGTGRGAPTLAGVSWATLGFQYDWTSRVYHLSSDPDYALHAQVHAGGAGDRAAEEGEGARADRWCTPFPADMWWLGHDVAACIHKHAAAALPAALPAEVRPGEWSDDAAFAWGLPMSLDAQSGICNLYPATKRLPMGAHVDNMERDYAFPVVSLSLGCTAVYLLGGATRDDRVTPVLLRSGDVAILSGDCRLAFHGVARVLEGTCPPHVTAELLSTGHSSPPSSFVVREPPALVRPHLADPLVGPYAHPDGAEAGDEHERAAFARFAAATRLNVNVRQVRAEGHAGAAT